MTQYQAPTLTEDQAKRLKLRVELDPVERQAREMLATYQLTTEWAGSVTVICTVFRAQHAYSLPVERIAQIGATLHNCDPDAMDISDLQAELTKMVKAGVLRSRMISKVRHYELNY